MGLAGWNSNNKLKLTIDNSKIDGDLTDFPVLITLSSGSGQTGFDATSVFDELITVSGSYVNRKKIAVTTTISGIETELYVEIERWESVTSSGIEQAWLWTKVPTIVSGTDTDLCLYYDSTHTTNSGYIGDVGESVAQNVWDGNFVGVWHMAQDPSGGAGAVLDSTSNANHCTAVGMGDGDLIDGKVSKALNFDSAYVGPGSNLTSLDHTIEAIVNPDSFLTADTGKNTVWHAGRDHGILQLRGDAPYAGKVAIYIRIGTGGSYYYSGNTISTGAWTYLAEKYSESLQNAKLYINTSLEIDEDVDGAYPTSGGNAGIGAQLFSGPNRYIDSKIDEVRYSNIARTNEWIKATYHSNWDDLITYTDIFVIFIFSNPIPTHLSTVYGTSHTLQLTTTISGDSPSYVYDAVFYDALDDSQIGSTVSGLNSGQSASTTIQTSAAIDYNWYVTATLSGVSDTSSTYNFTNKFLCSGTTEVDDTLTSGIPVRLYRRSTGELIGSTTSISGGLFEIESTYNENHYAVAMHPTDSGTNAFVYDWLTP